MAKTITILLNCLAGGLAPAFEAIARGECYSGAGDSRGTALA